MNHTERIWRQYHRGLRVFIQSRVGDTAAADDILQEVFVRIHTRIDTLKESHKINSWIYRITRNAIVDHYRSRKNMGTVPDSLAVVEADQADSSRREIESWLLPMIHTLPEPCRQALILSEIEALSRKEIATRQGVSLSAAKSRVQRGRAMLKKMLLDCCRFDFDQRGRVVDWEKKQGPDDVCC